jgi:hypothetical protein
MKTILSALIALSALSGIAASAGAADFYAKAYFEQMDRARY